MTLMSLLVTLVHPTKYSLIESTVDMIFNSHLSSCKFQLFMLVENDL